MVRHLCDYCGGFEVTDKPGDKVGASYTALLLSIRMSEDSVAEQRNICGVCFYHALLSLLNDPRSAIPFFDNVLRNSEAAGSPGG